MNPFRRNSLRKKSEESINHAPSPTPILSPAVKAARDAAVQSRSEETHQKVSLSRAYSSKSEFALVSLGNAEIQLKQSEEELLTLKSRFEQAVMDIVQVKLRLALLNGEVEKLQNKNIDSVLTGELTSGKEDARTERKQLNTRADALHLGIMSLHQACCKYLKQDLD